MNVLSIDLESWLHKYFFNLDTAAKKKKDAGYIRQATLDILEILEKNRIKTTFFIPSEIFDWDPWLIHKIRDMGHEIGFHTHTHRILRHKEDLLEELSMGRNFIEEFDCKGFRAPEMYIKKDYLRILRDHGFVYDSSIYSEFKVFAPIDGLLEAPVSTYPLFESGTTISFPRNLTINLMLREIPFGSGYYIGLLGSKVGFFIKKYNRKGKGANLLIHPWQIIDTPVVSGSDKGNLIRRIEMIPYNLNRRRAFNILLQSHSFVPMIRIINTFGNNTGNPGSKLKGEQHVEKVKSRSIGPQS